MDMEREFTASMGRGVWIDDDPEKVILAISRGFDPNYNDNDGATTLHRVAEAGCARAMSVFLQDPITRTDVKDHMQRTPLHYAVRCSNYKNARTICKYLLEAGLDINAESIDIDYPTPLFVCVQHMHIKLAAFLLSRGADIFKENFNNVNILYVLLTDVATHCTWSDLEEMIALFLYYNVDVNCCINTARNHPMCAALCSPSHGRTVIMQLKDHFVNYNHCQQVTDGCYVQYFVGQNQISELRVGVYTIHVAINLKLDFFVILEFINKLTFDYSSIREILLYTSQYDDVALFNYVFTRLRNMPIPHYYILPTFGPQSVTWFFSHNALSKEYFLTSLEKLFSTCIARQFHPTDICTALATLILVVKEKLDLKFPDIELIMYLMLPFINVICFRQLSQVFDNTQLSDEFELFLMNDPLIVQNDNNNCNICENCGSKHLFLPDPSTMFMYICNPKIVIKYEPMSESHMVPSLQWLSRNVIRTHLRLASSHDVTKPCHIFSYYNGVRKLEVPKLIKDIITLKHILC